MATKISFNVSTIAHSCSREEFTSPSGELEKQSKLLIESASRGDVHTVYGILKSGRVDCNVCDNCGNFALVGAAINCHAEIVNLLLDAGANVNQVFSHMIRHINAKKRPNLEHIDTLIFGMDAL